MAMDGSFNLQFSLQRFLARCTALRDVQKFDNLLEKGDTVTEEEVVSSVAELFLHPKYTIPLVGCFRPIVKKIVDKAVALLRFEAEKLRSNSNDTVSGYLDDEKVYNVIDFHIQHGICLNLHELACLAFCRALDLTPFLLGSVLIYFEFAPPPFQRILGKEILSNKVINGKMLSIEVLNCYLHAVRTSYRLLLLESEIFAKFWNWSCFLDIIREFININLGGTIEFRKVIADITWCGIHILSAVLKMSDGATRNFCVRPEEAQSCLLRWEEFCMDVAIEKAGAYAGSSEKIELHSGSGDHEVYHDKGLSSFDLSSYISSEIYVTKPPMKSRRITEWDDDSVVNSFVMTSTVRRSFDMVLLAVKQKWPVLLYGPAGAGKSALISKIAQDTGNQVFSIHMDDQLDGKTLVGSYVCTEQPGEFRWQPGSLTQAVLNGFWVVFEDIDKAPPDVLSILLPLLEGSSSFVTGYGEEIRVAESFRLFSTVSTSKWGIEGGNICGILWRKVMIRAPNRQDMQKIVKSWYPCLDLLLADRLVETFERVNYTYLNQFRGFNTVSSGSLSSLCRFSLRDLLKWCKRIAGLAIKSQLDDLSIYQEAVDVFASFNTSAENRLTIMKEIAEVLGVPVSLSETLYPHNKPIIQDSMSEIRIGRVTIQRTNAMFYEKRPFVKIRSSLHVLERLACSVKYKEPVLLVGETGTGKTTLVQHLAMRLGQRLTVLNLSQQSDVADLLGGFKPMDAWSICKPLYNEFKYLFSQAISMKENEEFFNHFEEPLVCENWLELLHRLKRGVKKFKKLVVKERSGSARKRKKPLDEEAWENFSARLETARRQIASSGTFFSFAEGAFVTALKNGQWVLLDEVNLAPPEILQRIIGVLDGENGSLCLAEKGDVENIRRHPNFHVFACMNPATDAGKRDLPFALRSRFTEYFVDDILDDEDLDLFIEKILKDSGSSGEVVNNELVVKIRSFYKAAKKDSEERLQDGANQKPQYSLRSLYRALDFTREKERDFGLKKAIYDGFYMFFVTLLDEPSAKIMKQRILHYLLGGNEPSTKPFTSYLKVKDSASDEFLRNYILTGSVKNHLTNLSRAVCIKKYPVLLQGPTSSGKTSLVRYLAAITGHKFVRINNHEHTDLQEYLGSYVTDASGKLVFRKGVLVEAVEKGYWIVLDELNLAPSDVLEALNRLLDDNRELFVPELGKPIETHPEFMLFATQNPPTVYGGRKMLSRAFRNRFVEIHVDEIPEDELSTILKERCQIPASYAKKMVDIMKELQLHRQKTKVFAGKHGFITPRDLFRWANHFREDGKSYEDLARDGYHLLAERLRDEDEKVVVQEVLERHLRVKLHKDDFYNQELLGEDFTLNFRDESEVPESLQNVILTKSMWRLFFLVKRCHKFSEPVLLVGETGGGKTTVCQLLSIYLKQNLHILNCHQYTETSDFLGGFYPIRDRSKLLSQFVYLIEQLKLSTALIHFPEDTCISSDIHHLSSTIDQLDLVIKKYRQGAISIPDVTVQDIDTLEHVKLELVQLHQQWQKIFEWQDGPLVKAMRVGDLFLVDEISLADDSVLERLNSVLEPERKLSLAEKGETVLEEITAHKNFSILATMNPSGDYGKKELSPALRNRFTEIWVPPLTGPSELRSIASNRISNIELSNIIDPMLNFYEWFNQLQIGRVLTVRDLLSWVAFVNVTERSLGPEYAFLHGAFLVVLDGISLGTGISKKEGEVLRDKSFSFLLEQLKVDSTSMLFSKLSKIENYGWGDHKAAVDFTGSVDVLREDIFGIDPFFIQKGPKKCEVGGFEFLAPTTRRNALRVLRAMQLSKPVLLEGSPGVGKTSLIIALGKFSGHKVVRINLSEQTDMMDLLGSDLPLESDEGMKFAWSDGILLQALKEGSWILLDELNLAPQSVLEGLNAILDHRAEVFIPELGQTFRCPSSFQVFACQNPSYQGGGRKGLPKSFLNRFTKVYVDELVEEDYLFICRSLYPSIPRDALSKLILFNRRLHEETTLHHKFAQDGAPWEFNLRDVIRSCQIMQDSPSKVWDFLNIIYVQRMRTAADRRQVLQLYEQIFGEKPSINPWPRVQLNSYYLIVGSAAIKRNRTQPSKISNRELKILPSVRHSLEAAAHCVQQQWLCILIGPPSSGKTSLVRLLAQLTGNVLNELNLSSATDISELLGCFEQYNSFRNFRFVVAQVARFVNEYSSSLLESSREAFLNERKDLITSWLTFLSNVDSNLLSGYSFTCAENRGSIIKSLSSLYEIVDQLKSDIEKNAVPVSWSSTDLSKTIEIILKLEDQCGKPYSAKFEWVTGLLIKAVENGEWIVLENANLCNPTVLDRINSLVESDGTITVNECGNVDGEPVVLSPHSNFRMFLTVNPSFGEVSRAMRNRGVEIFMMEPHWIFDGTSGYSCEEITLKDVKRFLVLTGIPSDKLIDLMAKAHVYAKVEGLHLNVRITYLELARWVQLFQQLLITGHQPTWSLQISWEHIYLSSLGEAEGQNIVNHANSAYLSVTELCKPDSPLESSLCLPGGWPMPLKIRDFTCYSKEVHVWQNCLYLEFLGSQYASHKLGTSCTIYPVEDALCQSSCLRTYLLDWKTLNKTMFPNVFDRMVEDSNTKREFDLDIANNMLIFAANWAIEQATENDFGLYLQWFSWFSSQLKPYCNFFEDFLTILGEEREHPIWTYIIRCRQELISLMQVDLDSHPIPMLSLELVDLKELSDISNESKLLCDAIHCVGLLRSSYQQWNSETRHNYSDEAQCFVPFLKSLRALEEDILNILVGSSLFDSLIQLYSNLLGDHSMFWEALTSWQVDRMLVSWHSLLKDAGKFKDVCPRAVEKILLSKNLAEGSFSCFHSERSLLWVLGGHPFLLPRSANLYHQQHKLLHFCESLWPTKGKSWNQGNEFPVDLVASQDPELRLCALEGVCMLPLIMGEYDGDDARVSQQMEEMCQMLQSRFKHEQTKLLTKLERDMNFVLEPNSAACCSVSSEILCTRSGFGSWLDTLPIMNSESCFLDMELLKELSLFVLVDSRELQLRLGGLSSFLESGVKYSLTYSTRPPQSLTPHQKLLWILDAWTSVDAANVKVASFVLEMWFWWHSFLWSNCPCFVPNFSVTDTEIPLPNILFRAVKTASVAKILQNTLAIRDFPVQSLKFKLASQSLWKCSTPETDPHRFLWSASHSLFQQIIFAHEKSFDVDNFASIKSMLCSTQKNITQEHIRLLSSLISSSRHQKLKSLVNLFIEPLLTHLYLHSPSTESYLNLGFAWLHIGGLRFHLLLSNDGLDPTMKYTCKLSQLEEKIFSLQLEKKVRQECEYLSGTFSSGEKERIEEALEKLEVERRKLQRKIVFRPKPAKFKAMRSECDEFLGRIKSLVDLAHHIEQSDGQKIVEEVCNWQATASCFIDQLSREYVEYIDMVQPVQVAVYEMKLGLSLVFVSALQKKFLNRIQEDDMDCVMDSIYSFMRLPRVISESLFVCDNRKLMMFSSQDVVSRMNFSGLNLSLLEKLVAHSSEVNDEKVISQLKAALYHNILVRVTHSIAMSRCIDNCSFKLLDNIFSRFASIWMNMKIQGKNQEDFASQVYKFKPRALQIEDVMEVDVSALGKLLGSDNLMEWKELLCEEEYKERMEDGETQDSLEEWNHLHESILINVVTIHNQLFGSTDSLLTTGSFEISEADRLKSFMGSYTLGVEMIKGLGGPFSSTLDAKLIQEHLLRISLEHEQKLIFSSKSAGKYNFYKDSNAPVMAKMVKLLNVLQQHVLALMNEWEDHPGLQKVMDVTEMLLAIPLSTPLAKALSGLQFLLNRIQVLQENGSKFPLSDQLEPLLALVCSWQKMEYESWPVLLDEVQDQYETNAAKLWFPLFSVLHHQHSSDSGTHDQFTIESLEDFIQTSSVGEFRMRLQLIFAFFHQISCGRILKVYSSPWQEQYPKILYNLFGYYVQFLPIIMEHIEANRRKTETELKELLKLCRWDRFESQLSIENLRKTRQKIRKTVQKYSDMLQQPILLTLDKELAQKGINIVSLYGPRPVNDISDQSIGMLDAVLNLAPFDEDRSLWFVNWRKKINDAFQSLHLERLSELCFPNSEGIAGITKQGLSSPSSCLSEWKDLWYTLEKICKMTIDSGELWRDANKKVGKKLALSQLLKLLESSGLHRHKSEIMELSDNPSSLFLQPSYDAKHILVTHSRLHHNAANVPSPIEIQNFLNGSLDDKWKMANQFYFKSLASMQHLQQACLEHHGDFTSEQVNRSISYLRHLIVVQQAQRASAYDLTKQMNLLGEYSRALENSYSSCTDFDNGTGSMCSLASNQYAIFKCMWEQKQLFDNMSAMLLEESLLLRTVAGTHLNSCQEIKAEASRIVGLIEEFIPVFKKSKESLDSYLLGARQDGTITTLGGLVIPYVASLQMEHLVLENFQIIKEFEEKLVALRDDGFKKSSVMEAVLCQFDYAFGKGKLMLEQFKLTFELRSDSKNLSKLAGSCNEYSELEANFAEALKSTFGHIVEVLQKLTGGTQVEASPDKITEWESLFRSCFGDLKIDELCDELLKTIHFVEKLMNYSSKEIPSLSLRVGTILKHIHSLVDLILSFGDGFLQDFLVMHKTVSLETQVLANMLAALYSKGLGNLAKDVEEDSKHDLSQDASGTGMGEGAGKTDVSDQITDEDQLLGTSEKTSEENDASNEVPSKNDKGIEMNEDFEADTYSVSEDSEEDDDNNAEEETLESAMGKTGDGSEVVDQKHWDKDEDENIKDTKEKYESGPSVGDNNESDREFRAKEDSATTSKEPEESKIDEPEMGNSDIQNEADLGDTEDGEDMDLDKEEAYADPTGLKPDELNQSPNEDTEMDEKQEINFKEEADTDTREESTKDKNNGEDNTEPADEIMEEAETGKLDGTSEIDEKVDGNSERDDLSRHHEENAEMNQMEKKKDVSVPGISDSNDNHVPQAEVMEQFNGGSEASLSRNLATEENWANSSEINNDLAPLKSLPSTKNSDLNIMVSDLSNRGKLADDQLNPQLSQPEVSSYQKNQANPYRSVGDALKEWKERVNVSVDLPGTNKELQGEIEDENANEYGYVFEFEEGTAQALGSATSEQIDTNVSGNEPDECNPAGNRDVTNMEIEEQNAEECPTKHVASIVKWKNEEETPVAELEISSQDEPLGVHGQNDGGLGSSSECLVSVKKSYLYEDVCQLDKLSIHDEEMGKALDPEEVSGDIKNNATALWRRYELLTTRLSQELAEQLRLVMEPTLASKLQGDYKTGKRINMKKVIPYIASHYRKDKIWLRRTRPNKRDYQVVIAVDDSHSMSESGCGDVAIKALVTVCRAMSQLEVGNLAVASFGKKGNIRLLHDFDQPFSGESGVKMISNLTFKQENTIADEPVVDLLMYLNNKLDAAVANARLPSGQNPLQQLVLIIGDGRLHEKERLKRFVRDVLSSKRMVAFLILDSQQESIMDLQEVVPIHDKDRRMKILVSKYLDSFPFPYYVVLRNIEALPKTLADLLRQWFELMQNSRD
ncbi:hypothetical protein SLA2020_232280 [Shorea laevis]